MCLMHANAVCADNDEGEEEKSEGEIAPKQSIV